MAKVFLCICLLCVAGAPSLDAPPGPLISVAASQAIPDDTGGTATTQVAQQADDRLDPYCGPRCTHEILKLYDITSVSLLQCVEELRWSSEQNGVDLGSIANLLQKHGIKTVVFEGKRGYVPQWPYPAVAHVAGEQPGTGHFVVLLPNATRNAVCIWDGLSGQRWRSAQEFSERVDGGILITSPAAIPDTVQPFSLTNDELIWRSGLGVLGLLIGLSMLEIVRTHRPSKPTATC